MASYVFLSIIKATSLCYAKKGVSKMRLLLAEDEKALSKALVTILAHNNYSVDAVYNGQDALEYLSTGLYDAAILDIMMPGLDGITVLKRARSAGLTIPVLLLTAKSEIDDRVTGLDAGADDYLTKPFAAAELLARVRAIIRRRADYSDPVLDYHGLMLERATYLLTYQGESVKLGNKEFQMMEMFLLSPTQLFSTEQFMDKIWGYESDADLNVVWVYISYLRKKLRQIGCPYEIRSNRNIGYSLGGYHD